MYCFHDVMGTDSYGDASYNRILYTAHGSSQTSMEWGKGGQRSVRFDAKIELITCCSRAE